MMSTYRMSTLVIGNVEMSGTHLQDESKKKTNKQTNKNCSNNEGGRLKIYTVF